MTTGEGIKWPVHPRACGEQILTRPFQRTATGSSPRLRGTDPHQAVPAYRHRFIPAPAGNSPGTTASKPPRPVHPRACGEQILIKGRIRKVAGSSPRLRGTDLSEAIADGELRFIPAPAGNRLSFDSSRSLMPVHPRACGEQSPKGDPSRFEDGSSPRLRGTVQQLDGRGRIGRFIPAPAGNSRGSRLQPVQVPVHPRACGEQIHAKSPGS